MEEQNKNCTCNDAISAFAFNVGRSLEAFMNNYNNGLTAEYQLLQAKILDFYTRNKDADDYNMGPILMNEFKATFNIHEDEGRRIEN